ncbi:MAG: S-layer homology domain-containing protein [Pseudoflavonifractor sp.]|nr:S-layer homology domain-containing protein [Pseudoflavonifractor sp.]
MRRIVAWVLVLSLLPGSAEALWKDAKGHWASETLERAETRGWITGYGDDTIHPDDALTWGHYLTMLGRAFWPDILAGAAPGNHWAASAMTAAVQVGILDTGGAEPDTALTRQEAAALLWSSARVMGMEEGVWETPPFSDWESVRENCRAAVARLTALGLLTGYEDGTFRGGSPLTRAEGAVLLERLDQSLSALPKPEETAEDAQSDPALRELGENDAKLLRLFGTTQRRRYGSEAEAVGHMAEITVPVWKLDKATGIKTTGHITFKVHEALIEDINAIFTEIWADPEQFPIYEISGYDWRGDSAKGEHNCGTAVDINANENYQIYANGTVGAGSLWRPEEDPWSISSSGSVVETFRAYGYTWGGDAWPTNRDYMHFSYLGV